MMSISLRSVAVVCFVLLCCNLHVVEGARLHLFMVGDINPREHILKNATERDLAAIRGEAEQIAYYAGMEFSEMCFFGYSIRGKQILQECKNLSVGPEDVIIFYFSGHGYTTPKQKNDPWPNLSCSGDHRGVPLSRIAKVIRDLKPRFALIFADCCNTVLPEPYAPTVLKPAVWLKTTQLQRNYQKIFLGRHGIVIIAGAKKAQPALATYMGSFCTRSFLESLQEGLSGPEDLANWQRILHLTSHNLYLKAQEHNRSQDLIYSIE